MRFVSKFCMTLVAGLSASILLASCGATNHFATYTPQFVPKPASRFSVGAVVDSSDPLKRSGIPADFNPSAELKSQLEKKLAASGLAADAGASDVIVLLPTISDYDPGNAAVRWLAPGAGATVLTVKCNIQQGGVDMGKINIRRTIEFGGLYTIGQWSAIFGPVASDIVDALQDKIRQAK